MTCCCVGTHSPSNRPGVGRSGRSCAIHIYCTLYRLPPLPPISHALSNAAAPTDLPCFIECRRSYRRPPTPPILVRPAPGNPVPAGPVTRVREREWVDAPGRGLENWFTEYVAADPDRARKRPHPRTSIMRRLHADCADNPVSRHTALDREDC